MNNGSPPLLDTPMNLTEQPEAIILENEALQNEDCQICCLGYDMTATNWKVLQCSHKLCATCYKQIEITRTTMEGVTHTFVKCPFCMQNFGIEIGTCPNGTMKTSILPTFCVGYEGNKTIRIQYDVNDSMYRLKRTAYLPDNEEGNKVLKLLKIAWDRRISFTIGTSITTGQSNVLVWNIHHKTAPYGGIENYGYPDETYLERVKWELKAVGIE